MGDECQVASIWCYDCEAKSRNSHRYRSYSTYSKCCKSTITRRAQSCCVDIFHICTHTQHTCPVCQLPKLVTWPSLDRRESKTESSSFAGVSVSGSLLSLHLSTASSPLLQNYFWHLLYCKAPLCSFTGFALSAKHLLLFLSLFLRKVLPHSLHSTVTFSACIDAPLIREVSLTGDLTARLSVV